MLVLGLTKTTLLDYPGMVATTVFTGGCNFKCPFCHNGHLISDMRATEAISEAEIFEHLKKRRGIIEGLCISGGEPSLMEDLEEFCKKVKDLGYKIKLDTNGSRPDVVEALLKEHLIDYVAMDIKNTWDKYGITVGSDLVNIDNIKRTVDILSKNNIDHEFRTTVLREYHSIEDLIEIAMCLKDKGKWYIQSFKDAENVLVKGLNAYSDDELKHMHSEIIAYKTDICLRGIE